MSTTRTLYRSFAAGVVSPELYARMDLAKYATGMSDAMNMVPTPHGPVTRRKGTRFLNVCAPTVVTAGGPYGTFTSATFPRATIIPFVFSPTDRWQVELSSGKARFHNENGTLLDGVTYAIASINHGGSYSGKLYVTFTGPHPYATGDIIYLLGMVGVTAFNDQFFMVEYKSNTQVYLRTLPDCALIAYALAEAPGAFPYVCGGIAERVYSVTTGYAPDDTAEIRYAQSYDVLTLTHPSYPVRELRRLSAHSWTLAEVRFEPTLEPPNKVNSSPRVFFPPTVVRNSPGMSAGEAYRYCVTALDAQGRNMSLPSDCAVEPANMHAITAITTANPGVFTTSGAHSRVVGEAVYLMDTTGSLGYLPPFSQSTYPATMYFIDTIPAANQFTLRDEAGVVLDTTPYTADISALTLAGTFPNLYPASAPNGFPGTASHNDLSWTAVPGASLYYVYKTKNGAWGYIGSAMSTTFKDDNIIPDTLNGPPVQGDPLSTPGNYPAAVCYYDQRRVFAGTNNNPQVVYATRTATETDLSVSVPSKTSDAISFRIAAREMSRIRHMVPINDILVLTDNVEYRVGTGDESPMQYNNIVAKPQTFNGANSMRPLVAQNSVIFASVSGKQVYEINYDRTTMTYAASDISILASSVVAGGIVAGGYGRSPFGIAWFADNSGAMRSLTYQPDQEVRAWSSHLLADGGEVESVSVLPSTGGFGDPVFMVVQRTLRGVSCRCLEFMYPPSARDEALADAYYVDCGAQFTPSGNVVRHLHHLEGKSVDVLADGAYLGRYTVASGKITLPDTFSKVAVGLPMTACYVATMPLVLDAAAAMGVGTLRNVTRVFLWAKGTNGVMVMTRSPVSGDSPTVEFSMADPGDISTPAPFLDGVVEIPVYPTWAMTQRLYFSQTAPVPLTLLGMALEVVTGG